MMVQIHVIFWVVEAWVHTHGSPCGICGGKSGKVSLQTLQFFPGASTIDKTEAAVPRTVLYPILQE
jgi:hypothetical protein